jgi:hypothetical protein
VFSLAARGERYDQDESGCPIFRWNTSQLPSVAKCLLNIHAHVCSMVTIFTIFLLPESG